VYEEKFKHASFYYLNLAMLQGNQKRRLTAVGDIFRYLEEKQWSIREHWWPMYFYRE